MHNLLHTPGFLQDKTCGFCGLNCTAVLVKNRNGKSTPKSACKRFYPFKVAWAAKLSRRNLSTNIPILCSFCPAEQNNYVWKYCLAAHLKSQHNGIALPAEFQVIQEEKAGLLGKQTWFGLPFILHCFYIYKLACAVFISLLFGII